MEIFKLNQWKYLHLKSSQGRSCYDSWECQSCMLLRCLLLRVYLGSLFCLIAPVNIIILTELSYIRVCILWISFFCQAGWNHSCCTTLQKQMHSALVIELKVKSVFGALYRKSFEKGRRRPGLQNIQSKLSLAWSSSHQQILELNNKTPRLGPDRP